MKASPDNITSLTSNEIFVFGSNSAGRHGAGAARLALDSFGAVWGQAYGMQGQTYAIITEDENLKRRSVPISLIQGQIDHFLQVAQRKQALTFLVTKIGCGLAGFKEKEIATLFRGRSIPSNVLLPQSFIDILNE